MSVQDFLQQVKLNAEKKAKEMAALELSVWNEEHEKGLVENFGFTAKQAKERKTELQAKIK